MKNLFYILMLELITINAVFGQVSQAWAKTYNPFNSTDGATALKIDISGNIYVAGYSVGSGSGNDYVTLKYNANGDTVWAARFNGTGNAADVPLALTLDASGNIYVTGYSFGQSSNQDYLTLKYNSSGVLQWASRYNGTGNAIDQARSIAVDNLGNSYVTGNSMNELSNYDYVTIKYNFSGDSVWVRRYNGTGNAADIAYGVVVDQSSNVYVTGSGIEGTGNGDYVTIKYNSSGVQQWLTSYNGTGNGNDIAYALCVNSTGQIFVTGSSVGSGTGNDYTTINYNSSGDSIWVRRYNGSGSSSDIAFSMALDTAGNVYITGQGNGDYTTIKYNPSGVQQWLSTYSLGTETARSLVLDKLGNVYVTGISNNDYATVKYNNSGAQQWVIRYNGAGSGTDDAYGLAVDTSGNVYITGVSRGSGGNDDIVTIKYSQPVGINSLPNEFPIQFALMQNYPNPFNPSTSIRFTLPNLSYTKLIIYDLSGREIQTLVNEQLSAGNYSVDFDASAYASGIYFYKLIAGEFIDTKKMALLK